MNSKLDNFAVLIAEKAISLRWIVILLSFAVVFIFANQAKNLDFATNYRVFFSGENPDLVAFEKFQKTYTKNDNFLFVLQPKNRNAFSPQMAEIQEKITKESWQIPYAIRVDSITNFQHTWADEDNLTVEDLIKDGNKLSQGALDKKKAIALSEPLLRNNLITDKADTVGINVVLQYPEKKLTEVPEAVAKARAMVKEIKENYPDVTVALSGLSMMNNTFAESGLKDASTLVPIMYITLLLMMIITLRTVWGTFATLFVIAFSTIVAMGGGGLLGIQLTPISMTTPTIVLTLAIADSVHILISVRDLMKEGMSKSEAIIEAIRINFVAVSITSLTTVVGFLTLNFSDSPPFGHLGNMTAIGITGAWAFSIFFLPAILSLMPMKFKVLDDSDSKKTYMDAFADFVIGHYKKIFVLSMAAAIFLTAMIPNLKLDDTWTKYFDESIEFRRDTDFAIEHLGSLYPIEFSIRASESGGISDPEYLKHIENFTKWLREHKFVNHVYTMSDVFKRLNKNMHGDDESYYKIPEDKELAAQYLLLYELSLPYGLDLNDRINIDKSAIRVTATLGDVSTVETRRFIDESQQWLKDNAPEYMHTKPTGATVMFSYIAERNIESMLKGNVIAIIIIAFIMAFALRSAKLGFLSIIPNAIPIMMTFGLWAMLVGVAGMAAATVTATSLGIIVDDSVHFLTKYLRGVREKGLDTPEAIRYAFKTVGKAIVVNSIILTFGFAVLAMSSFKVNKEMGLLTALAVVVALVMDFLLLPAILLLIGKKKATA